MNNKILSLFELSADVICSRLNDNYLKTGIEKLRSPNVAYPVQNIKLFRRMRAYNRQKKGQSNVFDYWLYLLPADIDTLDVSRTNITMYSSNTLSKFRSLTKLDISSSSIDATGLENIIRYAPNLDTLNISGCIRIKDEDMSLLLELTKLRVLAINCPNLNIVGARKVINIKTLMKVVLNSNIEHFLREYRSHVYCVQNHTQLITVISQVDSLAVSELTHQLGMHGVRKSGSKSEQIMRLKIVLEKRLADERLLKIMKPSIDGTAWMDKLFGRKRNNYGFASNRGNQSTNSGGIGAKAKSTSILSNINHNTSKITGISIARFQNNKNQVSSEQIDTAPILVNQQQSTSVASQNTANSTPLIVSGISPMNELVLYHNDQSSSSGRISTLQISPPVEHNILNNATKRNDKNNNSTTNNINIGFKSSSSANDIRMPIELKSPPIRSREPLKIVSNKLNSMDENEDNIDDVLDNIIDLCNDDDDDDEMASPAKENTIIKIKPYKIIGSKRSQATLSGGKKISDKVNMKIRNGVVVSKSKATGGSKKKVNIDEDMALLEQFKDVITFLISQDEKKLLSKPFGLVTHPGLAEYNSRPEDLYSIKNIYLKHKSAKYLNCVPKTKVFEEELNCLLYHEYFMKKDTNHKRLCKQLQGLAEGMLNDIKEDLGLIEAKEPICVFCQSSAEDDLIGAVHCFKTKETNCKLRAHENCLIWAPEVHYPNKPDHDGCGDLDEGKEDDIDYSNFLGITLALKRVKKMKCTACGVQGAVTGCAANCGRTYHYACAMSNGCVMNEDEHTLLCSKCAAKNTNPGELDENADYCKICGDGGELICCDGGCRLAFHIDCIGLGNYPDDETWLCSECNRCANNVDEGKAKKKKKGKSTKKKRK